EPCRYDRIADRLAPAAAAARARRHAKPVARGLVGARAAAEPRAVGRLGNPLAGVETGGEAIEPMRLAPIARRGAGDLLEDAVEVIAADARGIGQFHEARQGFARADQLA